MEQDILQLDNQLCFRLYSISRKMTKAYEPLLEKYHLTYPQYVTMLVVFEHEKIDFKELADRVNLKTATMTPIVQKLEQIGYVRREKNPEDNRKVFVTLTDEGKSLNTRITDVPIELAQRLQLTVDKYATLVDELDELDALLNNVLQQP